MTADRRKKNIPIRRIRRQEVSLPSSRNLSSSYETARSTRSDRPAYYANTYSRHYRYLIIGGKTADHAAPFAHLDDGQSRVTLLYFAGWKRAVYRNPLKNSTSSISRPLISGIRRGFERHEGRKNQAEGCDSAGLFLSPAPSPTPPRSLSPRRRWDAQRIMHYA